MKAHAIDQLPVVDEIDGDVGVVTLGHLMSKIVSAHAKPSDPVRTVMFTTFTQVTFSPRSALACTWPCIATLSLSVTIRFFAGPDEHASQRLR